MWIVHTQPTRKRGVAPESHQRSWWIVHTQPTRKRGVAPESHHEGGNPHCEARHPKIPPLSKKPDVDAISLLLCRHDDKYIGDVLRYLAACAPAPPPVWVTHEDLLASSQQVMGYVADVVALLRRLHEESGLRTVHLYTSLPFHAVSLLAANLKYVIDNVILMEYRSDLKGENPPPGEVYSPLRF